MSPCHVAQIVILLRLCLSIKGYWSKVVIRSYMTCIIMRLNCRTNFYDFSHLFLKCLNTVKLETRRHLHCQPFYAKIGDIHSLKYLFLFLILITRTQVEFFKKPRHFYIILFSKRKSNPVTF